MKHFLALVAAVAGGCLLGLPAAMAAQTSGGRRLTDAKEVELSGPLGEAWRRGAQRLGEDPYRSAAYLRSDFSFETNRIFVNYSGDISGRFIEIASLISTPARIIPENLPAVLANIGSYQKGDGHFGREVNWNDPLEPENSNAKLLPIFWGNSRLLVGLLEAYRTFDRPELLASARRLGDFYLGTAARFLDPGREAEYRSTGSYAAGYVTDYFPGIEGLARLYQITKDGRYLRQAERMAEFFARFDTLPIDHSHGNLITHHGLLLLHEITGKPEYLERPRRRWQEAVEGGYVWPMGGVGEKFRVSYPNDEGCSEADWLRLNLGLWRMTGDTRYLEMAERLLWNHYAMNRTANGGYGHHNFICDPQGPLLMKPEFTEAVWCCTFHGLLGLHTLKSYIVAGSDKGILINFPLSVTAPVEWSGGRATLSLLTSEAPGAISCSIGLTQEVSSAPLPPLFIRRPNWAERVVISSGGVVDEHPEVQGGYIQLRTSQRPEAKGIRVSFMFSPRLEDRRLHPLKPNPKAGSSHAGVTLWDGPHLLMANTTEPKPVLGARVSNDGGLRLEGGNGGYALPTLPKLEPNRSDIAQALKGNSRLALSTWDQVQRNRPIGFVFDLVTLPQEPASLLSPDSAPGDRSAATPVYYPPPESEGGWRKLHDAEQIRRVAGMDPKKLDGLRQWLLASDDRNFAAVIIRRGWIALEVERGNSAKTDAGRVASVSKAVCATVLAIASEQSQAGLTPRKMKFEDRAFDYIPWALPLSDPRKKSITVKQLLNHTSGICPEATGAPNDGSWEYVLGHSGDSRTAQLAFDPGTACGYSTHALAHAALVCETVTGKPYDQFAIEALFEPLGIEHWWFQYFSGGSKYGRHPSHGLGMPARDLSRIGYCMAHGGQWNGRQIIPQWFVEETAAPTHSVRGQELRFKLNAQTFSHGWQLPARLTGEGGASGEGFPADTRYKPGSGGQMLAFVPSLDLVVSRQTGSSGGWEYEEYVRRACAAVVAEQ